MKRTYGDLIRTLEQDNLVYHLGEFQPNDKINRVYINLRYDGGKRQYRGEKNCKIYLDVDTGMIIIERGKGSTGWNFEDALAEFMAKYTDNIIN